MRSLSFRSKNLKASLATFGCLVFGVVSSQGAPANDISYIGTPIFGYANPATPYASGTEYSQQNVSTSILVDGNLATNDYLATFAAPYGDLSYVGFSFATPTAQAIGSFQVDFEPLHDGGWFGSGSVTGPAGYDGQPTLTAADLTLPLVQVFNGTTWSNVGFTSDYFSQLVGLTPGGPATGYIIPVPSVTFTLDESLVGIDGIRLLGPNGGSAQFLAINEEAIATPEPGTWAMLLGGLGLLAFVIRRRQASLKF